MTKPFDMPPKCHIVETVHHETWGIRVYWGWETKDEDFQLYLSNEDSPFPLQVYAVEEAIYDAWEWWNRYQKEQRK